MLYNLFNKFYNSYKYKANVLICIDKKRAAKLGNPFPKPKKSTNYQP